MKYIKLVEGVPTLYTLEEFQEEHPDVNVYTRVRGIPDTKVLEQYDVYPFVDTSPPEEGIYKEGPPQRLYNGEWIQTWEMISEKTATQEEIRVTEEAKNLFWATPDQKLERFNICQACDRWKASTRQCKECGCFMDIKTKIKGSKCPLGKWDKLV